MSWKAAKHVPSLEYVFAIFADWLQVSSALVALLKRDLASTQVKCIINCIFYAAVNTCPDEDFMCKDPGVLTCVADLNDCSGRGDCFQGQCFCHVGWGGADCSVPACTSGCDDVRSLPSSAPLQNCVTVCDCAKLKSGDTR